MADRMYRALDSFSFDDKGRSYVIGMNKIVSEAHPAYQHAIRVGATETLFEEITPEAMAERESRASTMTAATETTTAAPGERRSVSRPARTK